MKYQNPYRAFYKPLSFILLLLGFSSFAWGEMEDTTILPIDDVPFTTIQNAIDIAQEGDVVRVPSGTYVENLNFGSKQIVLESISGPAHTILQAADKLNSVVILNGATIRGFTITGGTGKPAKSSYGFDYYGGGIHARGESVIERCIITGNGKGVARKSAGTFAGGVYAGSGSKITLRDSLLYDNYAWACGGALLVDHGANMKIENCTIFGNDSTNFFGHQGGVGMANGEKVQIENSIIWGNSGDEIGAFASIYARGTQATVSHSLIEGGFTGTGNLKVSSPGFVNQNNPKGLDGVLGTVDDGLRLTSNSSVISKAINEPTEELSEIDICGFLRIQGEAMDMGCYEYGNELPKNKDNENTLKPGIIAYYPFDGDALDQSGNRNHGVLENAVFMKDRFGKEDSALSPVTTETINFSQTLDGSRSISFWMKVAKLNVSSGTWGIKRNTQLIGLPNVTDNFNFPHCGYFEDETLSWDTGRGMRFYSSAGNDFMDLSQWNHVTYVYTGSLASSQVFYNAKLLSPTQTIGGSKDNFANSNQLVLLGQENSGNAFDDIRIYDRALSSDEVLELYELEKVPANAEEIILGFDLRMVEIDSNGPVSLGYPKYNEIEVSLPKFKISGETVTFGTWSKVRKAAQKELGWELIEGVQGSGYDDTNELHPVTKIGFLDAVLWCNALSKLAGLDPSYSVQDEDGKSFVFEPTLRNDAKERGIHMNPNSNGIRVPTGNEWEVAARGGLVGKKYPWGNEYPGKTRANWYVGNGMPNSTTEVGSYPENGYGLFDMSGGVWEMTWDDALEPDVETPAVLSDRYINRGGAWNAGWAPEVSTNGWSIKFDDRRHEFGFRVAANGASMGKPRPPVGPPTGTPEPLVDYIKLLREIMEEIAKVESELNDLSEQTVQKDAEIEKWESELVSINREINDARVQLADCLEDCNRTREEMAQVQKETLTHNLTIVELEGELRASAERLNSLRNDRDGMVKQITKIEKDMEEATAKLNTAHTPGWHYVPAYGWLWTSPEHYPLIYSNDREGWVYYERGTSDPWLYFDYNSEKWEQWFHDAPLFSSNN